MRHLCRGQRLLGFTSLNLIVSHFTFVIFARGRRLACAGNLLRAYLDLNYNFTHGFVSLNGIYARVSSDLNRVNLQRMHRKVYLNGGYRQAPPCQEETHRQRAQEKKIRSPSQRLNWLCVTPTPVDHPLSTTTSRVRIPALPARLPLLPVSPNPLTTRH